VRKKIRDYKDLTVWQRSMELVLTVHEILALLPRGSSGSTARQIRDAVEAVPSNIAEGHSRPSRFEFAYFIGVSHSSLKECESELLTLELTGRARGPRMNRALGLIVECSKMLTVLRRRLLEN
jgi:four helix bundle protein